MSQISIRAQNISKQYRIGGRVHGYRTLREVIVDAFKKRKSVESTDEDETHFWALSDVSFNIERGEVVGIIGRNGAGKSTLLKVLSRITEPTAGMAEIHGTVGSLLEVGTGFHPELTGRENTFLNGAILGMRRSDVLRKFDEIVAFAEVEKFIDTPVKHYSSGMYLRLAFAVAAHLDPEILLIDEVLAVGDATFQKKCLRKIGDEARSGRTAFFVSHNMSAVRGLCSRAIWLDQGKIIGDGGAEDIVQAYLNTVSEGSFTHRNPEAGFTIDEIVLCNAIGEKTLQFRPGDDLTVRINYTATKKIKRPSIWLDVQSPSGSCFGANMLLDGHQPNVLEGSGSLFCRFKSIPLLPQNYVISMGMRGEGKTIVLRSQEVASFNVIGDLREYGFQGERAYAAAPKSTPVIIPYEWMLPDGSIRSVEFKSKVAAERY